MLDTKRKYNLSRLSHCHLKKILIKIPSFFLFNLKAKNESNKKALEKIHQHNSLKINIKCKQGVKQVLLSGWKVYTTSLTVFSKIYLSSFMFRHIQTSIRKTDEKTSSTYLKQSHFILTFKLCQ